MTNADQAPMRKPRRGGRRPGRAAVVLGVALLGGLAVGGAAGAVVGTLASPAPTPAALASPTEPSVTLRPTPLPAASPTAAPAAPTPTPSPTPDPTPTPVAAPLTGLLVPPDAAVRRPIAVMIDDLRAARPQSGFNAASVVWHAPAEGGIPRYMLVFQETIPGEVGPVRSARQYYIAWAAEWRAVYVHVGGSPQSLATLRSQGRGQLVYNADEFRWGGRYLWRSDERPAPHNVYTDGEHLRQLSRAVGAADGPLQPAWRFGADRPLQARPIGGSLEVSYPANRIRYDYDRTTNTYLRSVSGESSQVDAAAGERVAPKNVVVMVMRFGRLNDGNPDRKRLEADYVGSGKAWIATGGRTIVGTWRKDSITDPTIFLDASGRPVTLTAGQTFIQVLATGSEVTVVAGGRPPRPHVDEEL